MWNKSECGLPCITPDLETTACDGLGSPDSCLAGFEFLDNPGFLFVFEETVPLCCIDDALQLNEDAISSCFTEPSISDTTSTPTVYSETRNNAEIGILIGIGLTAVFILAASTVLIYKERKLNQN